MSDMKKIPSNLERTVIMRADKADKQLNVRLQMSRIFGEGFAQWLGFFSKDKQKLAEAFAHMFVLDKFFIAIHGDEVAGMAACTNGRERSVILDKKELKKHFGWYKGTIAGVALKKEFETLIDNLPAETGSIEFVATFSKFRGQGIASQIITYILENTPFKNFVIEEVADTNTAAMNLYEKMGFVPYRKTTLPKRKAKKIGINHFVALKYEKMPSS